MTVPRTRPRCAESAVPWRRNRPLRVLARLGPVRPVAHSEAVRGTASPESSGEQLRTVRTIRLKPPARSGSRPAQAIQAQARTREAVLPGSRLRDDLATSREIRGTVPLESAARRQSHPLASPRVSQLGSGAMNRSHFAIGSREHPSAERPRQGFAFSLTEDDLEQLRSQLAISSWGRRRRRPWAVTEHGTLAATPAPTSSLAGSARR